jgi:hypothetical protein
MTIDLVSTDDLTSASGGARELWKDTWGQTPYRQRGQALTDNASSSRTASGICISHRVVHEKDEWLSRLLLLQPIPIKN